MILPTGGCVLHFPPGALPHRGASFVLFFPGPKGAADGGGASPKELIGCGGCGPRPYIPWGAGPTVCLLLTCGVCHTICSNSNPIRYLNGLCCAMRLWGGVRVAVSPRGAVPLLVKKTGLPMWDFVSRYLTQTSLLSIPKRRCILPAWETEAIF